MMCSKCKENKEVSAFGRDISHKSGVARYCKGCNNKASRESKAKFRAKVKMMLSQANDMLYYI